MRQNLQLLLLPREAADDETIREYAAKATGRPQTDITGYTIIKRSIDARGRQPRIALTLQVFIDEPYRHTTLADFQFPDVSRTGKEVVIIGAGPAGLFAALRLIELGIRPILLERGKDVRARRRDLAAINKQGVVNPESNYCFGEGGAGTYSDGKLYTRSNKRGDINRILQLFVRYGAAENILYDAHPHIGTNKLPDIITAMRQQITDCGGVFHFQQRLVGFTITDNRITVVKTAGGAEFKTTAVLLATGHSARDIYQLLYDNKILVESKSFALGVRIEHPQELIDSIQYSIPIPPHMYRPPNAFAGETPVHPGRDKTIRGPFLPPASYSLVEQVDGAGVFSFCMCPGGIIAPAATAPGELVVNGWSPSKRDNPYANSGMVVSVEDQELTAFRQYGPLAALQFQHSVEKTAFELGGGRLVAPAQRMVDFVDNKVSSSLPGCSYIPGIHPASLKEVLPSFIYERLRGGFKAFGKKMRGYYTNEAVVVATESRTSSPVRIPRDKESLRHPQISNLYPCGEGAGYAGGIVSAAMDGERVADAIANSL
ncbi:MAG: FAD-dependent monooxygenase [Puia sp.]|nr:FAD-dependent monooxygenase [Puia sp.]